MIYKKENEIIKMPSCESNNREKELEHRDNIIQGLLEILSEVNQVAKLDLGNILLNPEFKNIDNFQIEELKTKVKDKLKKFKDPDKLYTLGENDFLLKNKYKNLTRDIFKYLNAKDLINLGMTCKTLQAVTNSTYYWEKIYFKELDFILLLQGRDQNEVVEKAKSLYYSESSPIKNIDLKSSYLEVKRLNKNWDCGRPVVTTFTTSECVTSLHLDSKSNELIYSAADGSASMIRLYSYRKNQWNGDIYMQHHKQNKICDTVSNFHGHGGSIWCLARSEDCLFTGSYDKTIKIWRTRTGACLSTIRAHSHWVSSVHFDSNFEVLVSGSWDSTVKLWNVKTLQNNLTLNAENGNFIYCVGSDLGSNEVVAGNEFKNIDVWDCEKATRKIILSSHSERVNNLKIWNEFIFSGSEDKSAKVWDKRSGKNELSLIGHSKGITQVEYDRIRNRLFTASNDKTIKIWDLRKGTETRTLVGHSDSVCSIVFDQTKLISGSKDNSIKIWNFLN